MDCNFGQYVFTLSMMFHLNVNDDNNDV